VTREFTVFVDESGLFGPRQVGHRVVGALVVPCARKEAEAVARRALVEVVGKRGLPVHANRLAKPPVYGPAWRKEGRRDDPIRLAVRARVRALLDDTEGWFAWVGEHGARAVDEGDHDHWARMVRAVLGQVAVSVWLRAGMEASIVPVVAVYQQLTGLDLSPVHRALSRGTSRSPPRGLDTCIALTPARASYGLQVVDVLVHGLGPGASQELPVEHPERHTLRWLQRRFEQVFPASASPVDPRPHPDPCCGATDATHGRVVDAFVHGTRGEGGAQATPLPPNTLAYGVEGASNTLCKLWEVPS